MIPSRDVELAAETLRRGGLVAFPTETVYGLGADALNPSAVGRLFAVKGRPSCHPLIVHLASAEELPAWAARISEAARRLAEVCWPGPLTLLVEKNAGVPDVTTGGLASVGLRVPCHPIALELLQRFGGGIAAPSANRFGRVSPTRAEHVVADLGDDVDLLLDGGECSVGLESTILDVRAETPVLLRPGAVTVERIESILGSRVSRSVSSEARAPGMLASHYAPRARVEVVAAAALRERAQQLTLQGERVALLLSSEIEHESISSLQWVILFDLGQSTEVAAQRLYAALRAADTQGASVVLASPPVASGLGEALADRLGKAAAPRP
ncbi:MAG TPA: L-threonylcarbamoyladenylate synthase [Polyangiaceae bacterium]|nr:L-threonylcarbamoyladenylate synthase [Polyangiaceae bacterium]